MELRQRRVIRAFIGLTTALTLFTTCFGMSALLAPQTAAAAQTVPYKVNFQGRLTDNSGNILTDGLYNIKFRLFDALTVGTNKFEEDRIMTGVDNRIQITNGLFNIQFGDLTALSPTLFSGVFPLFLEVELPTPATATCATNGCAVFTEGAMTPRQPMASSPYAFNADTVDGIDSAGLVQLSVAQQTGSINVSGTITGIGSGLTSLNPTNLVQGSGAVTLQSATATALTLTSNLATTWSTTGVAQLTLQSGSGTLSLGSTTTLTASGALTIDSNTTSALNFGTGANAKTVTIGNTAGATAVTISSGTAGINIGDDATTKTIDIGGNVSSGTDTVNIATNATAADTIVIGNSNAATDITLVGGPSTTTSGTSGVIIGSATADATQINLQLDSSSVFVETGSTCSAVINQGSLYYNSASNVIRGCVNNAWEDMVSTAGLGLQLFGVVPDTGANPGDLASVVSGIAGPCKVAVGATPATVSWTGCTAYSGGRKVIVAAGTAASSGTGAVNTFQHLCLTGTNNQPVLSARGAEVLTLGSVSMPSVTAPILCLADIKMATNNNATISVIYDTRTYTTTLKETASINTTAPALGHLIQYSATRGTFIPMATAAGNNLAGVVVATTGAVSSSTVNAIIAVNGPASVKAITGTSNAVGSYILGSATAGYAAGNTLHPTDTTATTYYMLGIFRTPWTGGNACAINSDACAGSVLTSIDKR